MGVGVDFFSPSIYYYRTFFLSFQSVLSGLIRDSPNGISEEVLSTSTRGLREEPIDVPDEVLTTTTSGASVSCLSAHTREEEEREDFLVSAAAAEEENKNPLI